MTKTTQQKKNYIYHNSKIYLLFTAIRAKVSLVAVYLNKCTPIICNCNLNQPSDVRKLPTHAQICSGTEATKTMHISPLLTSKELRRQY